MTVKQLMTSFAASACFFTDKSKISLFISHIVHFYVLRS